MKKWLERLVNALNKATPLAIALLALLVALSGIWTN